MKLDEIGGDSLDTVELVMELEEAWDVNIPDDVAQTLHSVGDAVRYVLTVQAREQEPRRSILQWFAADESGEFVQLPQDLPYSVHGLDRRADKIIYTTKPDLVVAAIESADCQIGMIGRPGLPHPANLPWLRETIGNRTCLFLGDCDPPDLLICAWLREFFPVEMCGVSDRMLEIEGLSETAVTIPFSRAETQALPFLLLTWQDYAQSIGKACANMLRQARKLELEAVVNFTGQPKLSPENFDL